MTHLLFPPSVDPVQVDPPHSEAVQPLLEVWDKGYLAVEYIQTANKLHLKLKTKLKQMLKKELALEKVEFY